MRTFSTESESRKPERLKAADDCIRHLRNTIVRNSGAISRSLEDQTLAMLSHWCRETLSGNNVIRPGIATMAKWGRCSERQAQRNVRQLVTWGVIQPVADRQGGRTIRTAYTVHIDMLIRAMMAAAVSLGKRLIEKMRALSDVISGAAMGDKKGDTASPPYREDIDRPCLNHPIGTAGDDELTCPRPGKLGSALLAGIWDRYDRPRNSKRLDLTNREVISGLLARSSRPHNLGGASA